MNEAAGAGLLQDRRWRRHPSLLRTCRLFNRSGMTLSPFWGARSFPVGFLRLEDDHVSVAIFELGVIHVF